MNRDSRKRVQDFKSLGELSVIGLTLVTATMIGYGIGYWAERHWPALAPWGGVAGALIGIIAGFMEMIRTVRRTTRRFDETALNRTTPDDSESRASPHGRSG